MAYKTIKQAMKTTWNQSVCNSSQIMVSKETGQSNIFCSRIFFNIKYKI